MNNCFNLNRFGKYLLFDLKRHAKISGLLAIELVCFPFILIILDLILSLFHQGPIGEVGRSLAYCAAAAVGSIALPLTYGYITDKKKGTQWALVPASRLEKWLSMMVFVGVVYPLVLLVPFCGFLKNSIGALPFTSFNPFSIGTGDFTINAAGLSYLSLVSGMLFYLLCGLIFKKNKAGKAILTQFVICAAVGTVFGLFVQAVNDWSWFEAWVDRMSLMTPQQGVTMFNVFANISYLAAIGGLAAGCYFRVKTIKY